jgi:hypothetical protein
MAMLVEAGNVPSPSVLVFPFVRESSGKIDEQVGAANPRS